MRTNVRFPNSLDEVQMLQSLGDSAFARYLLGCFWYSKRRYDEAVSCLARDARKISRLCARSSSAGRLLLE
ncbi:putative transferase [Klebsiella pneumoniae]|uniref:Putative transferase n=1 Tax=Klebsiella pneumoniae TaxID=573 RepID=A0A2X3CC54_KLEPN|nr:putative transferase [Klebsiella pneumoniae]